MQELLDSHLKCKEMVSLLLEEDIRTRNDDLWLCLQLWQRMQHIRVMIDYRDMSRMFMPETISRVRREIQNKGGKWPPTDPIVAAKRKIKEEFLKDYYSSDPGWYNLYQAHKFNIK